MKSEVFSLRFSWGPRRDDLDGCAKRLRNLQLGLSNIDVAFSRWELVGKKQQMYDVPIELAVLKKWLITGVFRSDIVKNIMNDMGYGIFMHTNDEETMMTLDLHCGAYAASATNGCSLIFPMSGEISDRLLQSSVLIDIAKVFVNIFEPDHGVISSNDCKKLTLPAGAMAEAGWVTYLSGKYNSISNIMNASMIQKIGSGRLILASKDRFSSLIPAHVHFVSQLNRQLDPFA